MESRKRARRGTAPSRVSTSSSAVEPTLLPHVVALIDNGGQITLGAMYPIKSGVAIANDDCNCLAMLQRKSGETLQQLLERLDAAIDLAWTEDQFTDEINPAPLRAKKR